MSHKKRYRVHAFFAPSESRKTVVGLFYVSEGEEQRGRWCGTSGNGVYLFVLVGVVVIVAGAAFLCDLFLFLVLFWPANRRTPQKVRATEHNENAAWKTMGKTLHH